MNETREELLRLHEAARDARGFYEDWSGLDRMHRDTPSDDENYASWQAAEAAFLSALDRAFPPGDAGMSSAQKPTIDQDWMPRASAVGLAEGTLRFSSVGQLWKVCNGQWLRIPNPTPEQIAQADNP